MKIGSASGVVVLLAALGSTPVFAGSTSGSMTVTATVEESCQVDVQPLAFGTLASDRARANAQTSMTLTCTSATSYVVTLDDGRHGEGGTRRMADTSGGHFLAYDLYRDAARTQRWGSALSGSVAAVAPAGGRVELAVYGQISTARAIAGTYADTITVTVAF